MSDSVINYDNFKATHGESWDAVMPNEEVRDGDQTIFICGLSFKVGMYINCGWPWDNITVNWTVSYYNGNRWITIINEDKSTHGLNNGYWTYFYHNRSAEGTTKDKPDRHLWKITLTRKAYAGDCSHRIHVWVGGIAMMTRAEYDNMIKESGGSGGTLGLIKGYRPDYWRLGGTYGSDDAFIAGESPQVRRGTPISTTTGTYKWIGAGED